MKAIVIAVFSFALCLFINRYANLCATAFVVAGVPFTWASICFVGGCVLGYKMVKK